MKSYELALIQYDSCAYKKRLGNRQYNDQGQPCEDTTRRQPATSQGERPQKKQNLTTPWSRISSLRNCKKINSCCWSDPVCVFFLWKPRQTNIHPLYGNSRSSGTVPYFPQAFTHCGLIRCSLLFKNPLPTDVLGEDWQNYSWRFIFHILHSAHGKSAYQKLK